MVDETGVARMRAAVWAFLERRGIAADNPSDWPDKVTKLQPLRKQGAFDPFLGAVRFLGFVSDIDSGGGGTVVVEGSHALVRRMVEASPDGSVGSSADTR